MRRTRSMLVAVALAVGLLMGVSAQPASAAEKDDVGVLDEASCVVVWGNCESGSVGANSRHEVYWTVAGALCEWRVRDMVTRVVVGQGHVNGSGNGTIGGLFGPAYRIELYDCAPGAYGRISN